MPDIQEKIIAFESVGAYHDALSLYQKLDKNDVLLIKCLLRLNQPQLALGVATMSLFTEDSQELKDYQIEATWRLSQWDDLNNLLSASKNNDVSMVQLPVHTWGSHLAGIMSSVQRGQDQEIETRVGQARMKLMTSLSSIVSENTDIYTQAYNSKNL